MLELPIIRRIWVTVNHYLIHRNKKYYIKRMDKTKKWAIVFWLIIFHLIYYSSLAKNQLHLTMKDLSLIFSP